MKSSKNPAPTEGKTGTRRISEEVRNMAKRLTGSELTDFLGNIGIERVEPVGKVPASGENLNDQALEELSKKGDPVTPTKGMILEDPLTLARLFNDHKGDVCFPLTPDGHLKSHVPPPTEATLTAKAIATRYLLMHEDTTEHAQASADNMQPDDVATPIRLQEWQPGASIASFFGKKCDAAISERDAAFNARDGAIALVQRSVDRNRQRGLKDEEIADDLGLSLEEFLKRFPRT